MQADGERDVDVFADRLLSVDRIVIAAAFLLAAACCVPDIVEHGLRSSYTVLAVLAIALGAIFFYAEGKARSNSEEPDTARGGRLLKRRPGQTQW